MGRDLLTRPYGRFFNLAKQLSELGHEVQMLLFSYKNNENETENVSGVVMNSISIPPFPARAWARAKYHARQQQPDWILGFSDIWYGIMATRLAQALRKKALIDAYDNYESYIPWATPLHWLWRKALSRADLVTCAGPSLEALLGESCDPSRIRILPMTADSETCIDVSKSECRQKLGLDKDKKLVGCHGSLYRSRDIDTLFAAADLVRQRDANIEFVTSGRVDKAVSLPGFIHHLGYLGDEHVPYLIKSLDVLVIPNKRSRFGDFSYPVKLCEGMACQVPVVASRTAATTSMLAHHPEALVTPGDSTELAERIIQTVNQPAPNYPRLPSWRELTVQLETYLMNT